MTERFNDRTMNYFSSNDMFSVEIPVRFRPVKHGTFVAELKEDVFSAKQFSSIVQAMDDMEAEDTFELHLSTNGGSIDAGSCLLHAMENCKGHIHVIATGGVHSFGSAVLLKAHSFELADDFSSLIHAGSMGFGSDFSEYKQYSEFSIKAHERFIRNTYAGFLTDEEIARLLDGKPIVLDAQEWLDRSDKRNEWYKEQTNKVMKAIEEQNAKAKLPAKKASTKKPARKPTKTAPKAEAVVKQPEQ